MVIPEGDWYCPDCQHAKLLESLESSLAAYEVLYKSKEAEIKRRERLAFVSKSLNNMIPKSNKKSTTSAGSNNKQPKKQRPRRPVRKSDDDDFSGSISGKSCNHTNLKLHFVQLSFI